MAHPKTTGPTPRPTSIAHQSDNTPEVYRSISHVSGHDLQPQALTATVDEDTSDFYNRLSPRRKTVIVAILSFCAFLSPISSTSVLAATPEVAKEYNTTGSVINASNAGYMVFMGLSPIVWGPMSQGARVWGEFIARVLVLVRAPLFCMECDGLMLRSDIYRPSERGTAMGWFLSGTLIGPAMGPFIGGIIVTYSSWRSIFWLQTALAGTGVLGVFFLVPETAQHKKITELEHMSRKERLRAIMHMISPIRVLKLFRYWNQVLVACASSALLWNMYSLLTPIRYVLNPRFHLDSPLLGGLFYLAPGMGYILGTFMGGRWADRTVRMWVKKRNGVRVPEDRLRSAVPFMGLVMPACVLIYGWAVEKSVGGIPVPVIALFVQGIAQLFSFPSLNTYCLDVMPGQGAEVVAANYFVRYLAGCMGTGVVLPAIQGVGVGWFSTISALFLGASTVGVMAAIRWGESWRKATDAKLEKSLKDDASGGQALGEPKREQKDSPAKNGVLDDRQPA
ncbi:hypothetical protein MAC_07745 [Metarhizium acridum CQMa 102]|uniref:Major facilitator superfamily (MFS) profile domain-containing protein n=1 Tax=Metarhizium acridum (strain CQMa 102) TaxID=655827 RepID=E9ECZ7_METAQ|nr:uncharacterized protein MAC_07745 [Metarhizium acridum CQMa 102]EFY86222.1 hypothetical protein MAC_07745 [Metarhizium acridum CQMa 102]